MKKFLGSLELEVMELMWKSSEATVPHTARTIAKSRPRAYASVRTVMKRLAYKGLLSRIEDEKGLRYRVACSRQVLSETLRNNK